MCQYDHDWRLFITDAPDKRPRRANAERHEEGFRVIQKRISPDTTRSDRVGGPSRQAANSNLSGRGVVAAMREIGARKWYRRGHVSACTTVPQKASFP